VHFGLSPKHDFSSKARKFAPYIEGSIVLLLEAYLALGFIRGLLQNYEPRTMNTERREEKEMSTITIKIPNWLDLVFATPLLAFRLLRFGYTFRRIYLGEGEFAILDPHDYYRLANFKWFLKDKYALRSFKLTPEKTQFVAMHREIMNCPHGFLIDHKNNNPLDNRRANLRQATRAQNTYNRKKTRVKTSSLFIGVSFNKRIGKWIAYLRFEGKRIWLGQFDNEIAAAKAHDAAAIKYHGEFARLNFS
jgi:hypothetical protein